jgi:hypothetical protein
MAVGSSAIALHSDIGIPLVALRAERPFSTPGWVVAVGIATAATWTSVGSWRKLAAKRRNPS